jgi:hypothetical protein
MLPAQVGLGGDWGTAIAFGIIAMLAGMVSLIGLVLGLIAWATSFAWRRWPRIDEYFAMGAVVCLALYIAIWVAWGRMPTDWQMLLASSIGTSIGVTSAWSSHLQRSSLGE